MFGRSLPRRSSRISWLLKGRLPRSFPWSAARPSMGGVAGFVGGTLASGVTLVSCYSFAANKMETPPFDLKALRSDLEELISDNLSLGPLFVRLAWHDAGSWDCHRKDGAPNSASMRFQPECAYGGNNGLGVARDALEPLKKKYHSISYADLWVLAAYVAIEYMGGPSIDYSWGRKDAVSGKECGPDGRLPDAAQTQKHVREVFSRLGFTDRETVALIGAHTCGECHLQNSGFVGPWTHDKYGFDNSFFTHLLKEEWVANPNVEQLQFMDRETKQLMMLPADMALVVDPVYLKIAKMYAEDNDLWCKDFAAAFEKLTKVGTNNLRKVSADSK